MPSDGIASETLIPLRWLDAVGRRNKAALLALSQPEIAIHGPRGTAVGHEVLGRWFEGTVVRVVPLAVFSQGSNYLVHHKMEWLNEDGTVKGTAVNASVFEVVDGLVASYARDDEDAALERHGFNENDLIWSAEGAA